jgi:hypothetical protein
MEAAQDAAHECKESYEDCMNNRAQRVRTAIAQAPEKSDRAIAAELGVGDATVSRARRTVSGDTVERRIGKDGKARRVPTGKIGPDPAKSRLRLDLPPWVAASSTENTDHVEREYTNLITVWNNSSDPVFRMAWSQSFKRGRRSSQNGEARN